MYRRLFTGMIGQGRKTASFLSAMREAPGSPGRPSGIRARTTILGRHDEPHEWHPESRRFFTLDELEKFTELAAADAAFASVRRAVREQMVYDSATTRSTTTTTGKA